MGAGRRRAIATIAAAATAVGGLVVGAPGAGAVAPPIQVGIPVVQSISAGYAFGTALTTTGNVYVWGQAVLPGAPTPMPPTRVPGLASISSVSAGFVHGLALRAYGTAGAHATSGWGSGGFGSLGPIDNVSVQGAEPVPGFGAVADAVASSDVSFAITPDHHLLALGHDFYGMLGNGDLPTSPVDADTQTPVFVVDSGGTPLAGIVEVGAGSSNLSCALARDSAGRVWEWGKNTFCTGTGSGSAALIPGFGGARKAVQVQANGQTMAVLADDGTVWSWGSNVLPTGGFGSGGPEQIPGLTSVKRIAMGDGHGLALRTDGTVWAWGRNAYGELGFTADNSAHDPAQVAGISGVVDIAGGGQWSMALKSDGTVWTWGYNGAGQLGDGTTSNRSTPGQVNLPAIATPGSNILATGLFQPNVPARLIDTRTQGGTLAAGGTLTLPVAGKGPVPAGASAAWLNVTATNEAANGYLTAWPCDRPQPGSSNVNYQTGVDVPNAVAAPLSDVGSTCVYSQERTDVVVDVDGSFTTTGYAFKPVSPHRLADTRNGGRLGDGGVLRVQVGGQGGVPADAAAAVLNLTATNPDASGYLTAYPCDQPAPAASNVNYRRSLDSSNAVAVQLAPDGSACIYTLKATDVVVDVNGSFGASGTVFNAIVPDRLADTRTSGRLGADGVLEVQVTGRAGVPEGSAAALLNVTATGAADSGYLTVWPCDQARPVASNVNYRPNVDTPNAVAAPLTASGKTCIYSLRATDVVVDINGFFQ